MLASLRMAIARVRAALTGRAREHELDDELRAHLDLLTEEHVRRGLTPLEARAAARREFGGVDQIKEAYRDQRGLPVIENVAQDVRYALRMFRRNRGFALVVVLSLAVGIGVNTAIFSTLDALMLRPLPVSRPGELFLLLPEGRRAVPQFSYPQFQQFRAATTGSGVLAAVSRVARMSSVL